MGADQRQDPSPSSVLERKVKPIRTPHRSSGRQSPTQSSVKTPPLQLGRENGYHSETRGLVTACSGLVSISEIKVGAIEHACFEQSCALAAICLLAYPHLRNISRHELASTCPHSSGCELT
jgi:hypothetical protein